GRSASDLMHGLRVIKAMGGEPWAVRRYRTTSDAAADAGVATGERTGRLAGLGALVMSAVLAIVLIVAGLRLIDGQMSVGALIGILGMTAFLTEPMRALAEIVGLFAQSHGAADRIARLLTDLAEAAPTTRDTADSGPNVTTAESGITITGWPANSAADELTTAGGTLTCIVSEDAEDAAELLSALTSHARSLGPARMLVAPHDVDLFEGTIGSNITMVVADERSDAADEADHPPIPAEVLTASGADELLDLVDGGLDYRIQELGGNLSGGQRQRVALARALNAAPQILVLAEPTTAVDAVTEARIADGLCRLRRRTREQATIILTSSPAFLAAADTVVYRPTSGPPLIGRHADLLEADTDSAAAYRDAVTR
ncbi:MAG TPA: ABC transporter ATP-binding protein, partial [Brevibacterium sp.]|nr:ABC transporter ATP-binding protein [Brevibacterium sp.]